jgi:hypothetical protein
MAYKRLFILVEGEDDERFINAIAKEIFKEKYDLVMPWKYSKQKNEKINDFLISIKSMNADYIYIADINQSPCITAKKNSITTQLQNIAGDRIIIAIKEIESWYLAGVTKDFCSQHRIKQFENTDTITKEQFNSLMPKEFNSRIDFMSEILKHFSINKAKKKNTSFRYFLEKYDC